MKYKRDEVNLVKDFFSDVSGDISKKLLKVINDKYNTDLDDLIMKFTDVSQYSSTKYLDLMLNIKKKEEIRKFDIHIKVDDERCLFNGYYNNLREFIGIDIKDFLIEMKDLIKDIEFKVDEIEQQYYFYFPRLDCSNVEIGEGYNDGYVFTEHYIRPYNIYKDLKNVKEYTSSYKSIKITWVVPEYIEPSKLFEGLYTFKQCIDEQFLKSILDTINPMLENYYLMIKEILNNIK